MTEETRYRAYLEYATSTATFAEIAERFGYKSGWAAQSSIRRTAALVRAGWVFSIDAPAPAPKAPDCSWNRATPEERAKMLRKLQNSCM